MANASKKTAGTGSQGKGDGTGAMTELPEGVLAEILAENMVLSNRDKSRHSDERGLDSRQVQTEQYRDHAANRRDFDDAGDPRQPEAQEDASGEAVPTAEPSDGRGGPVGDRG
jgi:hypothetical protein